MCTAIRAGKAVKAYSGGKHTPVTVGTEHIGIIITIMILPQRTAALSAYPGSTEFTQTIVIYGDGTHTTVNAEDEYGVTAVDAHHRVGSGITVSMDITAANLTIIAVLTTQVIGFDGEICSTVFALPVSCVFSVITVIAQRVA